PPFGRGADADDARAICAVHDRRRQEMGRGHPRRQHQARLIGASFENMTTIIDTNHDVTAKPLALQAAGITTIGRYLNRLDPGEEKVIKPAEANAIAATGLRLFLIFEIGGRPSGGPQGDLDGRGGARYSPTVGAPA